MQHERRNISMLMDLYEMTMAHGYFTKQDNTDRVAFDVFTVAIRTKVDLLSLADWNKF